ncbi:DNA-binding transcriptional regulator, IclR family [Arachidicoccus rhizosphaerae]|jgi:DNA-binding IclR family transcriptional regulator|uniref:DNA-binding transcriptional regulator, IclR family n=1 Tax=Arachidicoccus rhizosphaerae TaxID=551991 RepID=A0A1H3WZB9_9BACT|nr:IclR family transcriptional regulator [Arachidicoccus rhizosphaerae]SDZ92525.1 DNA-binding transcriptional regulator, IclR family [Arachidicoccus rhizosphaerae]
MAKKKSVEESEVKYHAPALEKGLDILEFISEEGRPLSQADIALGINKNPSEIYRMLVCLEQRGYLLRDEISGKYKQSLKLYNLSHRHSPIDEIRRASHYPMDDLADSIKQSCHLGVLYQDKLIVVSQSRSPVPIALSIEEGSTFPVMLTASGKVLLAYMEENERLELLKRNDLFNEFPLRKQQKFLSSLQDIRADGHFITGSDLAKGIMDVTVPVMNGDRAIACLTIAILSVQLKEEVSLEQIAKKAKETARRISVNLGLEERILAEN